MKLMMFRILFRWVHSSDEGRGHIDPDCHSWRNVTSQTRRLDVASKQSLCPDVHPTQRRNCSWVLPPGEGGSGQSQGDTADIGSGRHSWSVHRYRGLIIDKRNSMILEETSQFYSQVMWQERRSAEMHTPTTYMSFLAVSWKMWSSVFSITNIWFSSSQEQIVNVVVN